MICEGWKEIPLEKSGIEIIDGDRGKNYPKTSEFYPQGYCLFLNAKNVTGNGFSFDVNNFITKDRDCLLRKGKLKRKDIILTTRGTVGNVAYYNEDVPYNNMRINSGMVILRCPKNVDERFFYLLMRSSYIQKQINLIHTGSAQPQLPISVMKTLQLVLPQLQEQKAIAATLSCLDDKIELNNQMNDTLEQMAQALFKSWFVDFEPFQDGEFEDSELGKIPKGWEVGALSDVCDVLSGGTPKTKVDSYWDGDIPFFTPKDVNGWYVFQTEKNISDAGLASCNSRLYPKDTVFITARGTVGKVVLSAGDMAMNQSCYALCGKKGILQRYLYLLVLNSANLIKKGANGAVFDTIVVKTFDTIGIVFPPIEVIKSFGDLCDGFFNQIYFNLIENQKLISLRDTFLPKLMSGEIRVPVESAE